MSTMRTTLSSTTLTRRLLLGTALAGALTLSGCGGTDTASPSAYGGASTQAPAAADGAEANDTDIAFLQGMTPHHEQAVEMAEIVLAADPPAEVAAIATQIRDAQDPEIEQMEKMLDNLGVESDGGAHGGAHGGAGMDMSAGHGGMMSEADMDALGGATGTGAARLFLEGMIVHHEGAIEASDVELTDGGYEPALTLAQQIKDAQTAEIAQMRELLTTL